MDKYYTELSKEISYALRHAPWEYELELDENGWVSVDQLLNALRENSKWENVTEEDLRYIIDNSDKKRHEISNGKIRAFYGHSIPQKIVKEASEPPKILYHGTPVRFTGSIMKSGLLPNKRQYVHLSADIDTALQVGKRRDDNPAILVIDAETAWKDGIMFYLGNDKVWLADTVPAKYIKVMQ